LVTVSNVTCQDASGDLVSAGLPRTCMVNMGFGRIRDAWFVFVDNLRRGPPSNWQSRAWRRRWKLGARKAHHFKAARSQQAGNAGALRVSKKSQIYGTARQSAASISGQTDKQLWTVLNPSPCRIAPPLRLFRQRESRSWNTNYLSYSISHWAASTQRSMCPLKKGTLHD